MFPSGIHDFVIYSKKSRRVLEPYLPEGAALHEMRYPIAVKQGPRVDVRQRHVRLYREAFAGEEPDGPGGGGEAAGVRVTFVGEGVMRQRVEEAYSGATVTGWVQSPRLIEELNRSRCFVLPSLWYEVNPLAPLEALGRGLPAIVSSVTTSVDEIVEGDTGFVFESNNVEDLTEKMRLMLDDDTVNRMGKAATTVSGRTLPRRRRTWTRFSPYTTGCWL